MVIIDKEELLYKIINIENLKEKKVSADSVFLDPNNPRFFIGGTSTPDSRIMEKGVQDSCLEKMKLFGIDELKESIQRIGFLPIDRIVVRKINGTKDKYVVVEGNRRLAALIILNLEYGRGEIQLSDTILKSIKEIEVLVYEGKERDIAWIVQGIRHISGVKNWGLFQQAKLLVKLHENKEVKIDDAAKSIGIGPRKATKLIKSYYGYIQCLEDEEFGELMEQDKFSFFVEAIFSRVRTPLQDWLDWDDEKRKFMNSNNLRNFLSWITSEEGEPRIQRAIDARDVLSKVIAEYPEVFKKFESRSAMTIDHLRHEIWKREELPKEVNEMLEQIKETTSEIESLPTIKIKASEKKSQFIDLFKKLIKILEEQIKSLSD